MSITHDIFLNNILKDLRAIRKNMEVVAKAEQVKLGLSSIYEAFPEYEGDALFKKAYEGFADYSGEGKPEPMKKPIVSYLSGPISSDMDGYQAKFNNAEDIAKEKGRVVLKPSILPIGLSELSYMRIGLAMVEAADEIVMLDGWEQSAGAKIELEYAKRIGKCVISIHELMEL